MDPSDSNPVAFCAETLRKADYDRYVSALLAPRETRAGLTALYAFNFEVAKTAETVSDPHLGLIRLQWWREAIAGIYDGPPRRHEVVLALSAAIEDNALPRELFDELIDARENDLISAPFSTLQDWEKYADATSVNLMRLGVRIVGGGDSYDRVARSLGIAYALTGLLRALGFHASRRRIMLPLDMIADAGLSEEDIFSYRVDYIRVLMDNLIAVTKRHLADAAAEKIPRAVLPAFLPVALIRSYLKIMAQPGFDPYCGNTNVSIPRKHFAMLGAMMRGKI